MDNKSVPAKAKYKWKNKTKDKFQEDEQLRKLRVNDDQYVSDSYKHKKMDQNRNSTGFTLFQFTLIGLRKF